MKIGIYFFKIKLFLVRLLCYEKPLRVVFTKYLSLLFKTFRPHYESVLYEGCLEAKKLGFNEVCVLELGVAQDYKIARKWYTLAAEQGDSKAHFNLGVFYLNGDGVLQDNIYAHMWANIAASNGNERGVELREVVAEIMTSADISEAQKLARECVAKNYKGC